MNCYHHLSYFGKNQRSNQPELHPAQGQVVGIEPTTSGSIWSGMRYRNQRLDLGKVASCLLTNPAEWSSITKSNRFLCVGSAGHKQYTNGAKNLYQLRHPRSQLAEGCRI